MSLPSNNTLDAIRSLRGKPRITYPGGIKTIERVATFPRDNWELPWLASPGHPTTDQDDTLCFLVDQQQLKEDNQFVEAYRIYKKLPGPTIKEDEFVPELNGFIRTEKTMVYDFDQSGSRTGGTSAADLVVIEYKATENPRVRIQVSSRFPFALIGKSWTFRAPVSFSIPPEIPVAPVVKTSHSLGLDAEARAGISMGYNIDDLPFFDAELDYDLKSGYTRNFSATVTRTLSMTSATDVEYNMYPEAYRRIAEIVRISPGQALAKAITTLKPYEIPHCIHPAWSIYIGKKLTLVFDPGSGPYPAPAYSLGPPEDVILTIPASVPSAIPYGQEVIAKVASTLWRGGLFVNDVYRIIIPVPSADPVAASPTFSLAAGTYTGTQSVAISSSLTGATIRFTTDGSAPTQSHGTIYTAPVNLVVTDAIQTITLRAVSLKSGYQPSGISEGSYIIQPSTVVAAPTFSPVAGIYGTEQNVEIASATSGATIHYTIDGTTPTSSSPTYSSAITLTLGTSIVETTIKALAVKSGSVDSSVATAVFTVGPLAAAPTFSPAAGAFDSHYPTVTIATGTSGADIFFTTDGSTPTSASTLYTAPIDLDQPLAEPPNIVLKAIAIKSGMSDSEVTSGTYNLYST